MSLKLGTTTYQYIWNSSLEDSLKNISAMGFRKIELMVTPPHLWVENLDRRAISKTKDLIQSCGLEVVAVNPTYGDLNLASPRPSFRKATLKELKKVIEFASELEVSLVVIIPGSLHYITPMERVWKYALDGVVKCCKFADDHGIIVALEHSPIRFVDTAEKLKKIIEETRLESIKALYDTANINLLESPVSAIEVLGQLIAHVHLADNNGKKYGKLPVGRGNVKFEAVADALKKLNYQGWSMIELSYPEDPDGGTLSSKRKLEALGWSAN